MKKFFYSLTLLLSLCACNKESAAPDEFVPLDTIVCTRTITFNDETKAGNKPIVLNLDASYKVNDDVITHFSISSPDPEIDVNTLKEMVREKFKKEYGFSLENSDLNQIMMSAENPTKDCLMDCQGMAAGEGRGWCRAGCIFDWAHRCLKEFVSLFKKS